MSEKTLRMSLYCLVAVTVLYLGVTMMRGGGNGAQATDQALQDAFAELGRVSHTHFEIAGPRETIVLDKADGAWTVNGFEADSGAVARFLRAVEEVEIAAVAATNPNNHGRLGVSADSAWSLGTGGGPAVLLGKTGNRFRTAYARLPDADLVSLIEGDLRSAAARPVLDWRNKVILQTDTAIVASIRVARDGRTVLYERQDSSWTADGGEADAVTVRNILQELANLRASGFAPDDAGMPAEPERSVQAADANGNELASVTLADGDGNVLVLSAGSPYIFEVPTFRADRIAPAPPDEG